VHQHHHRRPQTEIIQKPQSISRHDHNLTWTAGRFRDLVGVDITPLPSCPSSTMHFSNTTFDSDESISQLLAQTTHMASIASTPRPRKLSSSFHHQSMYH
jgi:hypothetical protein